MQHHVEFVVNATESQAPQTLIKAQHKQIHLIESPPPSKPYTQLIRVIQLRQAILPYSLVQILSIRSCFKKKKKKTFIFGCSFDSSFDS